MRRPAAILILLLLTSCRFYDTGKRAAAAAVLHSVLHIQAHAPLTQSAARPATPALSRAGRLIVSNTSRCSDMQKFVLASSTRPAPPKSL